MQIISQYMQQNHRECDELFVHVEASASDGNWADTASHFESFNKLLEQHLNMEEQVLFPAFETETGHTQGPTAVMRMEHEQIRGLIAELKTCYENQDSQRFLGLSESLMMLIQQHNMKEEQMLYPMTDQALSDTAAVLADMQALGEA
ncbi:MAG: hemerythrin domain-containing protein [Gammaproteobacteria bacterium]|nr:hemerythrin domain-containing protein [Gammaproteobacteria bacterium]MCP4089081.1 hemerythrin domain-containing protein [Gammaproteobacteria bacterium]MCP4276894.1 hemerythrin domain-containing protein [Gammaproteobacteria bacterium]MCP4830737.1 hemerythrin domain-containing protein [Gammaproteobacteria bacterium]MCP4928839.1 hemerythrin domain-containing protein [Gammaproteobacteria bacterium]